MIDQKINIFWFRRDLRLDDNAGLFHALRGDLPVLLLFIFDTEILDKLSDKKDARVNFLHNQLQSLNNQLPSKNTSILVKHGVPQAVWKDILSEFQVKNVFTNSDYEPYAKERDREIEEYLSNKNIGFYTFKDHVIFEKEEIVKGDGDPYVVFTPYSKLWKKTLTAKHLDSYTSGLMFDNFYQGKIDKIPSLSDLGFAPTDIEIPNDTVTETLLENYADDRNYPDRKGTSRLGIHLRFGTISIRKLAQKAKSISEVYLNELIWREFYQQILWHFPHVVDGNFRSKYDRVQWRKSETDFEAWCEGKTGYPIVDAGMRELNETGFMHNRVRMIVASFLTKHLLLDWRWGEAYFA